MPLLVCSIWKGHVVRKYLPAGIWKLHRRGNERLEKWILLNISREVWGNGHQCLNKELLNLLCIFFLFFLFKVNLIICFYFILKCNNRLILSQANIKEWKQSAACVCRYLSYVSISGWHIVFKTAFAVLM